MRKLLMLLMLLAGTTMCWAQSQVGVTPDCQFGGTFTAAGRSFIYDNRPNGANGAHSACTTWHMVYYNTGFSALSIELDQAPDSSGAPGAWTAWVNLASGALPITLTTQGQITGYKYIPWVSVNLNSVTGAGTIAFYAWGYKPWSGTDTSQGSTLVSGLGPQGALALGVSTAEADGSSSTYTAIAGIAGVSQRIGVDPFWFNGTTQDRQFYCPNTSTFSVASTTTQFVAASGATKVRICSFSFNPSTTTAGSVDIVYGTGANCGTGTTTLTGAYTLPASAVVNIGPVGLGNGPLITPASQAVCVRTVTATVNGFFTWGQW